MPTKLLFLAAAGQNKHGQALVRVKCECGTEFECRADSYKSGHTKSCGCTRKNLSKKRAENPAQRVDLILAPTVDSTFERGSIAFFDDEISRKESALISNENHIRFLELEIAQKESVNLDTLKKRKAAATTANDLRQEIARLQMQKANAETAQVTDTKSAADI